MSAPLRLAGWGRLGDGAAVTWTIVGGPPRAPLARGRRRRTGRAARAAPRDRPVRAVQPPRARLGGRPAGRSIPRATARCTATTSIRECRMSAHTVGWPFGADDLLVVAGSPIALAAIAWRLPGRRRARRARRPVRGPARPVGDARGGRAGLGRALRRRPLAHRRTTTSSTSTPTASRASRGPDPPRWRSAEGPSWTRCGQPSRKRPDLPRKSWISPFPSPGRTG